jgi:hypothetical protein
MFLRWRLTVIALSASLLATFPAGLPLADSRGDVARARQHFQEGAKHSYLGEYEEALAEFKEAYRAKDDPAFLFNIGQCQYKLLDGNGALLSFRSYLARARNPTNREEAEEKIAELEGRLPAMLSAPAAPVEGPIGRGNVLAVSAPASLAAPVPTMTVSLFPTSTTTPTTATTAMMAVPVEETIATPTATMATTTTTTATVRSGEPPRPIHRRWWLWTLVIGAAAGAVAAGIVIERDRR